MHLVFLIVPPERDKLDQKINLDNGVQKAVIKFPRNDITGAYRPIGRFFEVSGHFIFNGAECEFAGTDDIKKVFPEGAPGLDAGNTEADKGEGEEKKR